MTDFDKAFESVVGVEGGFGDDPKDRGNWTSGVIGQGECRGTKFGISAMAYPDEDIKNLTIERAKQLYKAGYWDKVKGDELPAPINAFVFDAAVNQGVDAAIRMLQKTVGVAQDGILGRDTLNAVKAKAGKELAALYMADRAMRYTGTRSFDIYGRGWFKRLFLVSMEA